MTRICSEPNCQRPVVARGLCSACYQRIRYHGQLDEVAPAIDRPCAYCGEMFQAKARRWGAMYCSKRCDDRARYARTRRVQRRQESCDQCGQTLEGRAPHARFCSDACGNTWRNARIAERTLEAKRSRPPCRGCGGLVAPERYGKALYCSDECKIRSRRHEAYGLTQDELGLLLAQHDVCAICGAGEWGKKGPQVDHCHETGRVRGVLCVNCNNGLGRFDDDPIRLRAAAEYLEVAVVR